MEMSDKQRSRLENGREYRSMSLSVRAQTDKPGEMIVEGYATTFDQPYELYSDGQYTLLEQVDSRAFNGCDLSDVIMQYDHQGRVFARTRNNTLTVYPDGKGLLIRADLSGTEEGHKLFQEIRDGYTDRMSFGFVVGEDRREYTEDHSAGRVTCIRTVVKIKKLYDVSAVSVPANDMTSISARTLADGWIAERKAEEFHQRKQTLRLKLLLEGSL